MRLVGMCLPADERLVWVGVVERLVVPDVVVEAHQVQHVGEGAVVALVHRRTHPPTAVRVQTPHLNDSPRGHGPQIGDARMA